MSQRLTPVDISNHRFRRRLLGYAAGEVEDYMRRVGGDLEHALTEIASLRERLEAQDREMAKYRALEATLRDALLLAQKAADETRAAAHAQAEAQMQQAQARVRETEAQMQARAASLSGEIERLRQERRRLARDLRALFTAQLSWITQELEAEETVQIAAPPPLSLVTAETAPPVSATACVPETRRAEDA